MEANSVLASGSWIGDRGDLCMEADNNSLTLGKSVADLSGPGMRGRPSRQLPLVHKLPHVYRTNGADRYEGIGSR